MEARFKVHFSFVFQGTYKIKADMKDRVKNRKISKIKYKEKVKTKFMIVMKLSIDNNKFGASIWLFLGQGFRNCPCFLKVIP